MIKQILTLALLTLTLASSTGCRLVCCWHDKLVAAHQARRWSDCGCSCEKYFGTFLSDPPDCADPCDCYGNGACIGPHGPRQGLGSCDCGGPPPLTYNGGTYDNGMPTDVYRATPGMPYPMSPTPAAPPAAAPPSPAPSGSPSAAPTDALPPPPVTPPTRSGRASRRQVAMSEPGSTDDPQVRPTAAFRR